MFLGESRDQDVVEVKVKPSSETPLGHVDTSNDSVTFLGESEAQVAIVNRSPPDASSLHQNHETPLDHVKGGLSTSKDPKASAWASVGIKRKLSPESSAAAGQRDAHKAGRQGTAIRTPPETPAGATISDAHGMDRQGPAMPPTLPTLPALPPPIRAGRPMFVAMRPMDPAIQASLEGLLPPPLPQNLPPNHPQGLSPSSYWGMRVTCNTSQTPGTIWTGVISTMLKVTQFTQNYTEMPNEATTLLLLLQSTYALM
jgi:hypothetical protein